MHLENNLNMVKSYINKTLEELENKFYPIPNKNETSFLIWRIGTLRKKIIKEFTTEDLRIMIGQNCGLSYLIPLAIEKLKENPFINGDYYPGDLLYMVLTCDNKYWVEHPKEKAMLASLFFAVSKKLETMEVTEEIKQKIFKAYDAFV